MFLEQNLAKQQLAIVALSTNNWPILKKHISQVLAAIDSSVPASLQVVECGSFSRKKMPER